MIRMSTIVIAAGIAVASALVFRISYDVATLQQELTSLNRDIAREREAIRVLKAEWAYMNRPERLRELARTYSYLAPSTGDQLIASLESVPEPLPGGDVFASLPVPGTKPSGDGTASGPVRTMAETLDGTDLEQSSAPEDAEEQDEQREDQPVAPAREPGAPAGTDAVSPAETESSGDPASLAADQTDGPAAQPQRESDEPPPQERPSSPIDDLLADLGDETDEDNSQQPQETP